MVAMNSRSWRQETLLHGGGSIREFAVTHDGHTFAVATNDGTIHVGTLRDDASSVVSATRSTLLARVSDIALTGDGLLVATCADGTICLYSLRWHRWQCLSTGATDLGKIAVAADGRAAVALDRQGRLIWIDLEAARKLLDMTGQDVARG
jgi:WD40 repeat protein